METVKIMSGEDIPVINVKKEVDKKLANVKEEVRVTISVSNVGRAAAHEVEIRDSIPEGLKTVGVTGEALKVKTIGPQGTYAHSYEVTSEKARRFVLPEARVKYYRKGGLFKGKGHYAKSSGKPSISFVNAKIDHIPLEIGFKTTFNNPSQMDVSVSRTVEIVNKKGKVVESINKEAVTVKPNTKKVLRDRWFVPKDAARGRYKARARIEYEAGGKKREIKKETSFLV